MRSLRAISLAFVILGATGVVAHTSSAERIVAAQNAIDAARAAGAEQNVADNELAIADAYLGSARKIARANANSEAANHLAYRAEMMGRRAYYLARLAEPTRALPD